MVKGASPELRPDKDTKVYRGEEVLPIIRARVARFKAQFAEEEERKKKKK